MAIPIVLDLDLISAVSSIIPCWVSMRGSCVAPSRVCLLGFNNGYFFPLRACRDFKGLSIVSDLFVTDWGALAPASNLLSTPKIQTQLLLPCPQRIVWGCLLNRPMEAFRENGSSWHIFHRVLDWYVVRGVAWVWNENVVDIFCLHEDCSVFLTNYRCPHEA